VSENKAVIALTGATGFVGKAVLARLIDQGFHVRSLVRPNSQNKTLQHKNITWVEGQLADPESEAALVAGADVVLHMAGLIAARTKSEYERINSTAVGTLAKAAQTDGAARFIYLSSLAAKAPDLSLYAWSKREGETRLNENFAAENSVIVRAPAVFGAEDVATAPIYACVRKGFLPAPGGRGWRNRLLSLIHVDDLADFLVELCVNDTFGGRTVLPSTRASISWPEFADACTQATGKRVRAIPLPLSLLYPVAGLTTALKAMTGKGHLTLGKLGEFLYDDWSVESELQSGTDLHLALKKTIETE
jgi:nucleoside-diphosphate-sugar epimerase